MPLLTALLDQFRQSRARTAIEVAGDVWTYGRLDEASSRIAGSLAGSDAPVDRPVAVLAEHGPGLIAAIVGVVRSGRCYLALNPSHSPDRLRAICEEIQPARLIVSAGCRERVRHCAPPLQSLEEALTGAAGHAIGPVDELAPFAIFYTSGSSRRPEPMVYTHGGTFHSVTNHREGLGIEESDRLSLLSPGSAAASVSGMFGALLSGAALLPFNPGTEGVHRLREWCQTMRPTVIHVVPSLFRRFVDSLSEQESFGSVRLIKFGGEPVFAPDIEKVATHFKACRSVVNGLGATEANGNVAHFKIDPLIPWSRGRAVPIGAPLPGFEILLNDESGEPVLSGATGEMTIRSRFLSPGRWDGRGIQPLPNRSEGWWKTGDLARTSSDGQLVHLGRRDDQFKSGGLWVSPLEAENVLADHPMVRESACVRVPGKEVMAAFVSWRKNALPPSELRTFLRERIDARLMPRHIFSVDRLPVLPNGKVDRSALAIRSSQQSQREGRCVPDRRAVKRGDALETGLIQIWEDILEIDGIGIDDDFFFLGGDSLAAVSVFAAIDTVLQKDIPVSALLKAPTVRGLAELIRSGIYHEPIAVLRGQGDLPPMFLVPGAGTDARSLRELSRHLGPDQPVYALEPPGLHVGGPFCRTVEEVAAANVALLREFVRRGPYFLCGVSFGGVVAFEMARRLREEKREPIFVGLVDSRVGNYPELRSDCPLSTKIRLVVRSFLPEFYDGPLFVTSWRTVLYWLRHWIERGFIRLDLRFGLMRYPRPYAQRFIYMREAYRKARARYRPRPYAGKVHLFRAADQPSPEIYETDPTLGWEGLVEGGMEIHEVSGSHVQIEREPHVIGLADRIRACVEQAVEHQKSGI